MIYKLPAWPHYDQNQIDAASEVLSSGNVNYWTGNKSKEFENAFAEYTGTKYAIAVSNGTLALYLSYLAAGIKKGDEVITTPRSFIATASTAALFGANVVFADVDIENGNIDPKAIKEKITNKTKLISVVHLAGWPVNIMEIKSIAKEYNLFLVEDCSQAHGAKIFKDGKFCSIGSFGDVSTWSFCQDKIISTGGEGGMVTTNSEELYELMWEYKDHGKNYKKVNTKSTQTGFRWLHKSFGSNFRLTEFQSAIGLCQLKLLDEWIIKRKDNANILFKKLEDLKIVRLPKPPSDIVHGWYKFYCYLNLEELQSNWNRDLIIQKINDEGFPALHGGCSEIYLEESFKTVSNQYQNRLPNAKQLGETSLMFLIHHTINENQMEQYAECIRKILILASKT